MSERRTDPRICWHPDYFGGDDTTIWRPVVRTFAKINGLIGIADEPPEGVDADWSRYEDLLKQVNEP